MSETKLEVQERPILFSGEMVRAILEDRKTQTRRVMKPQPIWDEGPGIDGDGAFCGRYQTMVMGRNGEPDVNVEVDRHLCPYGVPGDRLWVRETFATYGMEGHSEQERPVFYRADDDSRDGWATPPDIKWKPSIFMPRWASRIMLEITGVRVERVQDISNADAEAEGIEPMEWDGCPVHDFTGPFRLLWDSINAKRGFGWDKNPWVWVIEFKRLVP